MRALGSREELIAGFLSVCSGQAVAALTPNVAVAAVLNPFLLMIFNLFCGVTIVSSRYNIQPAFCSHNHRILD